MTEDDEVYLIWSHEHAAWWGPGGCGYYSGLAEAGRYGRSEAVAISANAIPGTAYRLGALPELPVRLADVETMRGAFRARFPEVPVEDWE